MPLAKMMLCVNRSIRWDLWKATLEFIGRERTHRTIDFVTREVCRTSSERLIFGSEGPGLRFASTDLGRGWFGIVRVNDVFNVPIEHGLTNLGRRMFGQGSSNGTDHENPKKAPNDEQRRHDFRT